VANKPKAAKDWNFVDARSQEQKETRRLVRIHAARRVNQGEKSRKDEIVVGTLSADAERDMPERNSRAILHRQRSPDFNAKSYSGRGQLSPASQSGPVTFLGAGRVDPFRTYPIASRFNGVDECFDYCEFFVQ
jgi:hypothetical protein